MRATAWNAGNCCGFALANPDVDDIAYFREMVATLIVKYQIDPKRVYITGWSNGGKMTLRAVCELGSDTFRAAAPFAGSLDIKKITKDNSAGTPYSKEKEATSTS